MLKTLKGSVNIGCYMGGRKIQNKSSNLTRKVIEHRKYYSSYFTRGRIMIWIFMYALRLSKHFTSQVYTEWKLGCFMKVTMNVS